MCFQPLMLACLCPCAFVFRKKKLEKNRKNLSRLDAFVKQKIIKEVFSFLFLLFSGDSRLKINTKLFHSKTKRKCKNCICSSCTWEMTWKPFFFFSFFLSPERLGRRQSRKTFSEEFLMLIIHRGYVWERTNGSEGHKTEVTVGLKCLIVGLLNYCYISWESWGITLNQPRFPTSPNERVSNSKYLKLVHQFAYRRSNGSFRFSSPKDYVVMINSDAFLILWIETEECFLRGERCSKINDCVHRRWKIFGKFRLFHFFALRDVLCSSDQ